MAVPVHTSPYAGDWYPANAAELETLLNDRFAESERRTGPYFPPDAVGFVVPHAAPAWSGAVAAAVYRAIERQQPEHVILLAFPHRGGLGRIATPDVEAIATPLGETAIDRSFLDDFPAVPEWRLCDHSFEIQLPFLQRAAPRARLTPLYVGPVDDAQRLAAAKVLAAAWRPGAVFVASSDFTHYGRDFGFQPFPNDAAIAQRLRDLDFACIDAASSLDAGHFLQTLEGNGATVCGAAPVALLLEVLRTLGGSIYQRTFDYQTSGEINGDFSHSVSYAALGYYGRRSFELDDPDRQALLGCARETLRRLRESGARDSVAPCGGSPALTARRGVFVSLHQKAELLGCIGNLSGKNSLAEDVPELTLSAALEDSRFRPAAQVAGDIEIEISVLTPFRLIRNTAGFSLGRHGAYLTLGERSGLLLPHVAADRDWTIEHFWRALSRKSGLWPDAWRDPKARLWVFEAQSFAG
jgi:AmmeMemoRadiSam system protein B/AmmeMemoRadiSam system protein A